MPLPGLHPTLSEHWAALSRQFSVRVDTPVSFTPRTATHNSTPALQVPVVATISPSSPTLTATWAEQPGFFHFLLLSSSAFSSTSRDAPPFTIAASGHPDLVKGFYSLNTTGLQVWNAPGKQWVHLIEFATEDWQALGRPSPATSYFRLI